MQTQRATWCTYLSAQLHATKVELENTPSGVVPFQNFKGESFKPFPQFDTYETVINWADYPLPPYTEAPAPDKPLSVVDKPGLGSAARGVVIRGGASGASSLSVDAPGEKVVLAVEDGRAIWSILFVSGWADCFMTCSWHVTQFIFLSHNQIPEAGLDHL